MSRQLCRVASIGLGLSIPTLPLALLGVWVLAVVLLGWDAHMEATS